MKIFGAAKAILVCFLGAGVSSSAGEIDFNRDIRPLISNQCLICHGPDEEERKAGLRLDTQAGSRADLGGYFAIVPGKPEESELLHRLITEDEDDRMPPPEVGPGLSSAEVDLVRQWIAEGADYAEHWSYVPPSRPVLPEVENREWVRNPIDYFVLAQLESKGWSPSKEADRWALARRAAIDLTGLPPQLEDVEAFLADGSDLAYERYIDGLLHHESFGERWARVWLDLARYADSAGYADDPPRTIWAYRDYVIRALNDNLPFDQFTVEQLAGDLLPEPTEDQLIATAFHRNTMTNSEGGTNDEQFRNEAIVDRVNTTMQVWMGTTMACAQCHTHKYDPITQKEYFEFFAFFNNTEDSDKRNEAPLLSLYSEAQRKQEAAWKLEVSQLKTQIQRPNDLVAAEQKAWESQLLEEPTWTDLKALSAKGETRELRLSDDGGVVAQGEAVDKDVYRVSFPIDGQKLSAVRLNVDAQASNFAVTQVEARWMPAERERVEAQYVRIELPGNRKILSLAEVEVISGGKNIAPDGAAKQSSTGSGGVAQRGIDGNTNGDYNEARSTTHTATSKDPWWELDLQRVTAIEELRIWNRTDGGEAIANRISGYRVKLLGADRSLIWEIQPTGIPAPSSFIQPGGESLLALSGAEADYEQKGFSAASVLQATLNPKKAWAVGGQLNQSHSLSLVLAEPLEGKKGGLELTIRQESQYGKHLIDSFSFSSTDSSQIGTWVGTPARIRKMLKLEASKRTPEHREAIRAYFRTISPTLKPQRDRLATLEKKLREHRPLTTVPIFRELAADKRRETHIQVRGNYLNKEEKVTEGTPAAFHPLPRGAKKDRLALARWLVSPDNPLTARVIANRHWEQLLGRGIVSTSEEFGSQGELPSHPELLDWLAVELMDSGWDIKHLLKLLVTSATYRQSSVMTDEALELDPDNEFYARGPRFRLSAEMIRDQALAIGGLLSNKMFGPPVRPFQPQLGVKAAFGSGIDWEPSKGADKYRRGLYTNWRRSNPYPSMTTFDAPTREVCTVRRQRSNTPLQALVTLNDPVYIEAAQGLARRIAGRSGDVSSKLDWAFRTALIRPPSMAELERLEQLFEDAKDAFTADPERALEMATIPLGDLEKGADVPVHAAWTLVSNVLLNLDEIFLKR